MIFFSRKPKPKPVALPPGWPSPVHNKCSQPDCAFPNSPQTTKGVYVCRGVPGGFYCEGTYKISSSRAHETERYLNQLSVSRRAMEEEQRKRTASEMRRPGDPSSRYASSYGHPHGRPAHPLSRKPADVPVRTDDRRYHHTHSPLPVLDRPTHSRRPSRLPDVLPRLPPSPSSFGVPRPSSSQVEAEYITDQIMMHLYPEQKIQPRWI